MLDLLCHHGSEQIQRTDIREQQEQHYFFHTTTGWFQPETEPRFAVKVVTWLVSFLANFKFIKMTAVHFQSPTDLLAAAEGRCIDLRSLLDLRSTQYMLECK